MIRGILVLCASAYIVMARRSRHATVRALPPGPPYPVDLAKIDRDILTQLASGLREPSKIATAVLKNAYPETWEGMAISWPMHAGAPANLLALQERVKTRAEYLIATMREDEAQEVYP
ncbi:MAG: hypothetical protein V3V20_02910 [Algisphaera sp.]